MSPYAADLPGIEPTTADLAAITDLPWHDAQAHLESVLADAETGEINRVGVTHIHLPASELPEGRAAA